MFTPVTAEGILGEVLAKSYANTQDNNNRLPYNARPIVIVTANKKMQIESLVMQILKKLTYWNNGKEPLVASVIRCEPALHSTLNQMCIYNNRTAVLIYLLSLDALVSLFNRYNNVVILAAVRCAYSKVMVSVSAIISR